MERVVMIRAKTSEKKYKCPYCESRIERSKMYLHIQNKHEDEIPPGYTARRVAFNTVNGKTTGHCIMCGKETPWNEDKCRYERLCSEECKEAYKKMCADRNQKRYGTDRLQSDPRYKEEVEKKALAGRRISGKYKFQDGGVIDYVGSYEKKFLEFADKVMNIESVDLQAPGPSFEYSFNGENKLYISDFYYVPYNLIIEVKDGGDNPNNNPEVAKYKEGMILAKEDAVRASNKYNYIRLTNNDFGQLLGIMAELKFEMKNECYDPIMRINESILDESKDESHLERNHKTKKGLKYSILEIDKNFLKNKAIKNCDPDTYERFRYFIVDREKTGEAIIVDNKPIGWVFVSTHEKENGDRSIGGLNIEEKYRGYGLSHILIDDAINKFGGNILGVYTDNKIAIKLYKDHGFVIVETRKDPDETPWYLMRLNNHLNESYVVMVAEKDLNTFRNYFRKAEKTMNEAYMSENMGDVIGAAFPPQTQSSCYIVNRMQNNVFSGDSYVTEDPLQYTLYGVKKGKAYKITKHDLGSKYTTFRILDDGKGKELLEQMKAWCENGNCPILSENYLYETITGSKMLTEDQIMYDSRFEQVKDFKENIQESCDKLYNYFMTGSIKSLEEQAKEFKEVL